MHYFGLHLPSERHNGTPKFGTGDVAEYDHELRYLDGQLGLLLKWLDEFAKRTPTAVFVTADHGEAFSPRGRSHGTTLKEEALKAGVAEDHFHAVVRPETMLQPGE